MKIIKSKSFQNEVQNSNIGQKTDQENYTTFLETKMSCFNE